MSSIVFIVLVTAAALTSATDGAKSQSADQCTKHCIASYPISNQCKASDEVILRSSDCAFMKKGDDPAFKFVVGINGQAVSATSATNDEFLCCKPNQETATLFIVGVANKRLLLAKDVASYKFVNNVSIDDFVREEVVLKKVLADAAAADLGDSFGTQFFQDQMDANKIIQKGYVSMWNSQKSVPAQPVPDLQTETRPKVTEATDEMILALKAFQPYRDANDCAQMLNKQLQSKANTLLSLGEPNGEFAAKKAGVRLCGKTNESAVRAIDEKARQLLA